MSASSVWTRLAGRFLELPPPRCRVERSTEWVAVADGTRLATTLYRPLLDAPRSTIFARSVAPAHEPRRPAALTAQLLAEQGHRVVIQECRGVQASDGRLDPFRNDGADGADTLAWLAAQPGAGGPTSLLGFGYAGHAAWATLALTRQPIQGLLVGFASRDPHAWLRKGGAFELENGVDLALSLAAAEPEGARRRDLARALRFRPLSEADRVAARRIDWLRGWLQHPRAGPFWEERTPPLPETPPRTLLIGGWYHPSLPGQLADYTTLARAANGADAPRPRLLIGPWTSAPQSRRDRAKGGRLAREIAGAAVAHLQALCEDGDQRVSPVRVFVGGSGWRDVPGWPPVAEERVFYLDGDGRSTEGGRLVEAPPDGSAAADAYVYDPADAVPSEGGAGLTRPGATALRAAETRSDVLRYWSEPFPRSSELAGRARLNVFVSSDAPHSDFTARLARVDPNGTAFHLCDGIQRVQANRETPARVEIELAPCCHRLLAGERLRLEISSSSFPRFDRHSNTSEPAWSARNEDVRPARQCVHHDVKAPSQLQLSLARG